MKIRMKGKHGEIEAELPDIHGKGSSSSVYPAFKAQDLIDIGKNLYAELKIKDKDDLRSCDDFGRAKIERDDEK